MRSTLRSPLASGSFRRQIVVLTACVTAFAMLLLTLVLQLILADQSRRDLDQVLEQRADAILSSASDATTGDRLVVPDLDLDRGIVVYDGQGVLVAGTPSAGLGEQYAALAQVGTDRFVSVGQDYRLLAHPFTTESGVRGVVVVSERRTPYEEAETYALLVSIVTGILATAATAAAAAWVVGRVLRPVASLTESAADWSEHDLGQRFDLGPPGNEITQLAAVLDTLLDKVAAAIRSEQRLTSELAHELRTPLTTVQGTADLALMRADLPEPAREDLRQIAAEARRMGSTITTLLEIARTEASLHAASSCALGAVVADAVSSSGAAPGLVHVDVAEQHLAVPHEVALRALTPVVANAVRHASSRVGISAPTVATGLVTVMIEDDGEGVVGDRARIFEPGSTSGAGSGAGLGLAIARRMARSVGGEVDLERSADPTRFVVRLPRA